MRIQKSQNIHNWNMFPVIKAREKAFTGAHDLSNLISNTTNYIARGCGRSYGDASLFNNIVSTTRNNRILSFDMEKGIFRCQSGVTIQDVIMITMPHGWFMPVTPGTKFVTIGGAVAADVHGKNHHKDGSFSRHLISMTLMLADMTMITCSKTENEDLFWATCGGMGLTGIVLDATFKLRPIKTNHIEHTTIKACNLTDMFELIKAHKDATYSVAWIDTTAKKQALGRGILNIGEHVLKENLDKRNLIEPPHQKPKIQIPFNFPNFFLNSISISLFNQWLYDKQRSKTKTVLSDFNSFFYPLDAVGNWNRLYGSRGFLEYQYAVPKDAAKQSILEVLSHIRKRGFHAFLAGLKLFGKQQGLISFPMEGYTFGFDLPIQKGVFTLLDELDKRVLDFGGRIYLAKDARMSSHVFRKGYPNADRFRELIQSCNPNNKIQSLQSKRLETTR